MIAKNTTNVAKDILLIDEAELCCWCPFFLCSIANSFLLSVFFVWFLILFRPWCFNGPSFWSTAAIVVSIGRDVEIDTSCFLIGPFSPPGTNLFLPGRPCSGKLISMLLSGPMSSREYSVIWKEFNWKCKDLCERHCFHACNLISKLYIGWHDPISQQ